MANNQYVNKISYNGNVLMDLTGDTVSPENVLDGVMFHSSSGEPQQGSLVTHNVYDGLDSSSTSDALSANQGKILNDGLTDLNEIVVGTIIQSDTDLNDLTGHGFYSCATAAIARSLIHCPITSNFVMIVIKKGGTNFTQLLFSGASIYTRTTTTSGWLHWYSFNGTDTGA